MENKTTTATTAAARPAYDSESYRPRLSYYHPNGRGTGGAIQFELHPAHGCTDGSIFATFARQKTVGTCEGSVRTFPRFDWANRICVKLDMSDLLQMLQVFRGMQESIADGKGLFHRSTHSNTIVKLDGSLTEAARDLGANERRAFLRVTLPLSMPGIISGISMVFLPAMTNYVVLDMLNNSTFIMGSLIGSYFSAHNWHNGSMIALVLLGIICVFTLLTDRGDEKDARTGGALL